MKLSKLMTIATGALSLAACSQHVAKPGQPFCQSDSEGGAEIVDPSTKSRLYTMGDIHESKTNYVWGDAIDEKGENTGLGLNVYLANGEIVSCKISDNNGDGETYYPKPAEPTGP